MDVPVGAPLPDRQQVLYQTMQQQQQQHELQLAQPQQQQQQQVQVQEHQQRYEISQLQHEHQQQLPYRLHPRSHALQLQAPAVSTPAAAAVAVPTLAESPAAAVDLPSTWGLHWISVWRQIRRARHSLDEMCQDVQAALLSEVNSDPALLETLASLTESAPSAGSLPPAAVAARTGGGSSISSSSSSGRSRSSTSGADALLLQQQLAWRMQQQQQHAPLPPMYPGHAGGSAGGSSQPCAFTQQDEMHHRQLPLPLQTPPLLPPLLPLPPLPPQQQQYHQQHRQQRHARLSLPESSAVQAEFAAAAAAQHQLQQQVRQPRQARLSLPERSAAEAALRAAMAGQDSYMSMHPSAHRPAAAADGAGDTDAMYAKPASPFSSQWQEGPCYQQPQQGPFKPISWGPQCELLQPTQQQQQQRQREKRRLSAPAVGCEHLPAPAAAVNVRDHEVPMAFHSRHARSAHQLAQGVPATAANLSPLSPQQHHPAAAIAAAVGVGHSPVATAGAAAQNAAQHELMEQLLWELQHIQQEELLSQHSGQQQQQQQQPQGSLPDEQQQQQQQQPEDDPEPELPLSCGYMQFQDLEDFSDDSDCTEHWHDPQATSSATAPAAEAADDASSRNPRVACAGAECVAKAAEAELRAEAKYHTMLRESRDRYDTVVAAYTKLTRDYYIRSLWQRPPKPLGAQLPQQDPLVAAARRHHLRLAPLPLQQPRQHQRQEHQQLLLVERSHAEEMEEAEDKVSGQLQELREVRDDLLHAHSHRQHRRHDSRTLLLQRKQQQQQPALLEQLQKREEQRQQQQQQRCKSQQQEQQHPLKQQQLACQAPSNEPLADFSKPLNLEETWSRVFRHSQQTRAKSSRGPKLW